MISGENIERAERILAQSYKVGPGDPKIILDRTRVDHDAWDNFVGHHSLLLFKKYLPEIDPRHEPAINTMLMHFFAVGAISQRCSEGRS